MQRLLTLARWSLLATVLVPLLIDSSVFFPFAFPKLVLFRSLVELSLAAAALAAAWALLRRTPLASIGFPSRAEVVRALVSPLGIAVGIYLVSAGISTLLATDVYRAFWGDVERGEGFLGLIHVGLFGALLVALFRREDWRRYLHATVVVGFLVLLYGLFQHFGITGVPFARHAQDRAESFIGNPAFLATHALFVAVFAWMSIRQVGGEATGVPSRWLPSTPETRAQVWKWFAYVTVALAAFSVLLTGTRGAMIGLAVGGVVVLALMVFEKAGSKDVSVRRRRIRAGALLGAIIVFGGVFWSTRSAPFWQLIPGLNRLAVTAGESLSDASTETRLITWRLSGKAFLEKPLFGWGPEHYITAYERHYNPAFAYYGETWLDRAHNKFIDIGVTQGAVGLVAYLGILVALAVLISRRTFGGVRAVFLGFLISYVVQNLVLFDQVVSYLTFAAFVAWLAHHGSSTLVPAPPTVSAANVAVPIVVKFPVRRFLFSFFFFLLFFAALASVYLVNLLPYAQARAYKESPALGTVEKVTARLRDGMYPYTYAQWNIRGIGVDVIYQDQYFYYDPYRKNPKFRGVGDLILSGSEEVLNRHPAYDVRAYIRHVQMLQAMARDDASYYVKAEPFLRKALELSPTRQELFYLLAFTLVGEDKAAEAVEVARQAVALDPRVARAHFHLGLMLDAAGKTEEAKAEIARTEELDPSLHTLLDADFRTLGLLYAGWGDSERLVALALKSIRGEVPQLREETYTAVLAYFRDRRDTEHFITVARFIKGVSPKYADDMDTLIDLATKGNWEILMKL